MVIHPSVLVLTACCVCNNQLSERGVEGGSFTSALVAILAQGWGVFISMGPGLGGEGSDAAPGPFGQPTEDPGVDLLLWVLVSTYGLGVLCGWFLRTFWVRFGIGNTRAATSRVVGPWEVLTSRALRFVRRRRAISLAFSNLRESSLRQSVQSRPNLRRRATLAGSATPRSSTSSELTPLREGPAFLQHGPNRRGAQQHGDH